MLGKKGGDRPLLRINIASLPPAASHSPAPLTAQQGPLAAVATTAALGEIRQLDLNVLERLGEGSSGAVHRVVHLPSGTVMARKTVMLDPSSTDAVVRELTLMHAFASPYIVQYYGCYTDTDDPRALCICMEYCDLNSLDVIYRRLYAAGGWFTEDMLGTICVAVLRALQYLHRQHKVIHRDVKPSNILVTTNGAIKLCDFGVSGLLVESMANTFVGTSFYMAPERIQGQRYTVRSDVWSLGITLLELALGRFPYPFDVKSAAQAARAAAEGDPMTAAAPGGGEWMAGAGDGGGGGNMPIFEVLDYIIHEPAPSVPMELVYSAANPGGRLSDGFRDFITRWYVIPFALSLAETDLLDENSMVKDAVTRPSPDVIAQHGFVRHWGTTKVDTAAWAAMVEQCR
ncbi:kinase-like domain-containing protein [Blastocladiella britannica]|nr:kinase-like domain-containing protein [Blastocladiella britannica]